MRSVHRQCLHLLVWNDSLLRRRAALDGLRCVVDDRGGVVSVWLGLGRKRLGHLGVLALGARLERVGRVQVGLERLLRG